jgi:hypothetical protein
MGGPHPFASEFALPGAVGWERALINWSRRSAGAPLNLPQDWII